MSNLFSLDWKDFLNGLIMAVLGNVVFYLLMIFGSLYELVMKGQEFSIEINFKAILVIAIFSFLTYLSKRLFSGATGNVFKK